jgi:hypothetical protein
VTSPTTTAGADNSSSGVGDQVSRGVDRIRETAKWLVAGFGALGGALITSLQLSDLGQVTGDNRWLAIIGFGLGISGVLVALLAAASVLVAVRISLTEICQNKYLKDYVDSDPELLGGFPSLKVLRETYDSLAKVRVAAFSRRLHSYYGRSSILEDNLTAGWISGQQSQAVDDKKSYESAESQFTLVNPAVAQILAAANFEKFRHRWSWIALPGIIAGVVIAAIGASLYATGVSANASASSPPEALVQVTPVGQRHFGSELGPNCDLAELQVLVLQQLPSGWQLETISDDCNALVFNASKQDVKFEDVLQPCPLPSGGSTSSASSTPSPSSTPLPKPSPPSAGQGPAPPVSVC